MDEKVQHFANNCKFCVRTNGCHNKNKRIPPEPKYDPCNGREDLVGELSKSNSYTYIFTATNFVSHYLFAILTRETGTALIIKALLINFKQNAQLPLQILTDKGSVFTSKLIEELI